MIRRSEHPQHPPGTSRGAEAPPLHRIKRLIAEGKLSSDEYKNVHLHRIDGSGVLDDYQASSRLNAEWDFFVRLRDAGRRTARSWLAAHYPAIGTRSTIDLQAAALG